MTAVITPPRNQIILQGISWATYQGLVRDLEAAPGQRLTYDEGTLEIMVPLSPHEGYKKLRCCHCSARGICCGFCGSVRPWEKPPGWVKGFRQWLRAKLAAQ